MQTNKSHDAYEKDKFAKVANGSLKIGDFYLFEVKQGVQKKRPHNEHSK